MDPVALEKVTVIMTVNVRVVSPVCRCRARMYAAPIQLATWIIVAIAAPVARGKVIVTMMRNVRAD